MWLLERFGRAGARCLVDVGANVGEWTSCAVEAIPHARVYAVEPVHATAELLRANVRHLPHVVVVEQALGASEGERELWYVPSEPGISSFIRHPRLRDAVEVRVSMTTGDRLLDERGIDHVDLLKLDVEGAEDEVLRGFGASLAAGRIDAVQFEYGPFNATTRYLLRDFYDFFKERDYTLGKIYPGFVDIRRYSVSDEDFRGPNYLAVRSSRADLIRAVGGDA